MKSKTSSVLYMGVGAGIGFGSGYFLQRFFPNTTVPYVPDFNGIGINKVANFVPLVSGLGALALGYFTKENHGLKYGAYGYGAGALGWVAYNLTQSPAARARLMQQRNMLNRPAFRQPIPVRAISPNEIMRNQGSGRVLHGRSSGNANYHDFPNNIHPPKTSSQVITS